MVLSYCNKTKWCTIGCAVSELYDIQINHTMRAHLLAKYSYNTDIMKLRFPQKYKQSNNYILLTSFNQVD